MKLKSNVPRFTILLAFFIIVCKINYAQIEYGGVPLGFSSNLSYDSVPFKLLPNVSNTTLYDSIHTPSPFWEVTGDTVTGYDSVLYQRGKSGFCHRPINETMNAGFKKVLIDGSTVIRWIVVSPGALSIRINFENFSLDSTETIFLYSYGKQHLLGAYNSLCNTLSGSFSSGFIADDTIVIEYNKLSASTIDPTALFIKSLYHEIPKEARSEEVGDCYINSNCTPYNELCNSIRSTVKLYIVSDQDEIWECSGVLVTDAGTTFESYIVTAKHCLVENGEPVINVDKTWVRFNFQAPNCNDDDVSGPVSMTLRGVSDYWLSDLGLSNDVAIVKFRDKVPIQYNAYYSGWSRETNRGDLPSTDVRLVHHPGGVNKKTSDGSVKPSFLAKKWFIHWDESSTEGGSSGAPLFDSDNRLIGSLSGGLASCDNTLNDYCGKIGKFEDFKDVIATTHPNFIVFSMAGVDPLLICQPTININGNVLDAERWRATNDGSILIQAEDAITLNSNYLTNPNTARTTFASGSNYVLQAGSSVTFLPGTTISRNVESFTARIEECNPINNVCYNYTKTDFATDKQSEISDRYLYNYFTTYPNPSDQILRVHFNRTAGKVYKIGVYNQWGALVFDRLYSDGSDFEVTDELNVISFASGLYFAILYSGAEVTATRKFIIEH